MWISRRRRLSAGFFPSATLDMNFAQSRYLGATPSSLTVTRASDGYADDDAGVWSVFTSNVARITNKGLLVEEARTNSVTNNSMQGAVAGTPGTIPTSWSSFNDGGLTRQVVGVGVEDGIDYIDIRYSGTSSNTFFVMALRSPGATAAATEVWTASIFMRLVAGSLANVVNIIPIQHRWSTGASTSSTATIPANFPTSRFQRFVDTSTAPATTTNDVPAISGTITNGAVFDFTLRIGWPQLELGAFATSPIRTTTVAVTRAADVVSLTGGAFTSWYGSPTAATLFVDYEFPNASTAYVGFQLIALIHDGTTNNRIGLLRGPSGTVLESRLVSGGSATNPGTVAGHLAAGRYKAAVAGAVGASQGIAALTGTVGTASSPAALAASPTTLSFGVNQTGAAEWMGGYIRRIAYFPSRLANAELQAITT